MAAIQVQRQEVKYQISLLDFKKIEYKLRVFMKKDIHLNQYGFYKVRSLYFDTPFEKDRLDVLRGNVRRHKVRLRIYDTNDDYAKLELKAKEGKVQNKTSIIISKNEVFDMIDGKYEFLKKYNTEEANLFYLILKNDLYRPRVMVEYSRIAYYLPSKDIRVTFDFDAKATRLNFDLYSNDVCWSTIRPSSVGVLEVKFNGYLFTYVQELLSEIEKMPNSNGKYIYACNI